MYVLLHYQNKQLLGNGMRRIHKMLVYLMLLVMIESKKIKKLKNSFDLFRIFRQAWVALGDMSKEQAKEEFIKLLIERGPMFKHYLEAHHVDNEEKDRLR
jgi:hypothetical protein